jgi:hypothetical protein
MAAITDGFGAAEEATRDARAALWARDSSSPAVTHFHQLWLIFHQL